MNPEDLTKLADHAAAQAGTPTGVVWFLSIAVIALVIGLFFLVRWMFTQFDILHKRAEETAKAFTDHLKTKGEEMGEIVANNTTAMNVSAAESKATRAVLHRVEDQLKFMDRRQQTL